jgi:hypothetical protein
MILYDLSTIRLVIHKKDFPGVDSLFSRQNIILWLVFGNVKAPLFSNRLTFCSKVYNQES